MPQGQQHDYSVTGTLKHGNKHHSKKHDLSGLNIHDDHYVVRHFSTFNSPSGVPMEDPGSSRIQIYDKETFKNLSKQGKKDGKQIPSVFEEQGLGVDVLHEPPE